MVTTPGGRGLGLRLSLPDLRDHRHTPVLAGPLPPKTNNRAAMPPVRDQGPLGSCTAFASTTAAWYTYMREDYHHPYPGSPLFQYWNERFLEGSTASDSGATIADSLKALGQWGICAEHWWPYVPALFAQQPPDAAYANAIRHKATSYARVSQAVDQLKLCLAAGHVVCIGVAVYESFEGPVAAATGQIPLPQAGERLLGWHAQVVCDYDDGPGVFTSQNSWGPGFGDAGYLHFSYSYLADAQLSSDWWVLLQQK